MKVVLIKIGRGNCARTFLVIRNSEQEHEQAGSAFELRVWMDGGGEEVRNNP